MLAASPHEHEHLDVSSLGATFWFSVNKQACVSSGNGSVTEINKISSLDWMVASFAFMLELGVS